MADTIRAVDYYYTTAPDKAGEGARLLGVFRSAGVSFLALIAFPESRRSQLDFVPADPAAFLATAKAAKIKVSRPKKVFLIEGDDRVGALHDTMAKLAGANINVTAFAAVTASAGRYGAMLWVKPRDVKKAAAALGAM
jgi:hypothetical protein